MATHPYSGYTNSDYQEYAKAHAEDEWRRLGYVPVHTGRGQIWIREIDWPKWR